MPNPFLTLPYETAIADLGPDYADPVTAAEFPQHLLRFRNDDLLHRLGLNPEQVADEDFLEAFGYFQSQTPFLALRYHGYQFGEYNPYLGDGRGFLYGQVRGTDGKLYDFGTKGSGQTPYSRTADGRLTLKGGVREVLAAEVLHQLGVNTSRCLSMIETGESLWRGDEPSPTRSSVMVRFSQSHVRFGTFERLHYIQRPDLIPPLLDHVIAVYYPEITATESAERYLQFYQNLVERVATLAAQWMVAGFCHGVLNTDNMSITGESFDYGPYAFIPTFDPKFTAAYFDYSGRYCYGNQPRICHLNLELLQTPLRMVMEKADLEAALDTFDQHYFQAYRTLMLRRLGLTDLRFELAHELVQTTVQLLTETQVDYGGFFAQLSREFATKWREDVTQIFPAPENSAEIWQLWRDRYHHALTEYPAEAMDRIKTQLQGANPQTVLLRPVIETVWEAIANEDNWQPFNDLLATIAAKA